MPPGPRPFGRRSPSRLTPRTCGPRLVRMRPWLAVCALALGCGSYVPAEGTGGAPADDSGGSESTGGEDSTGGTETGGADPGTGGADATGGEESSGGGVSETGGEPGTGGAETGGQGSGGDESSGGTIGSGGSPGSGGAASGGSVGSGGQGTGGSECECTEGPCCDGCDFRPDTYQCADDEVYNAKCLDADAEWCTSHAGRASILQDFQDVWCSGESAACDGETVHAKSVGGPCGGTDVCLGEPGEAYCAPCGPG